MLNRYCMHVRGAWRLLVLIMFAMTAVLLPAAAGLGQGVGGRAAGPDGWLRPVGPTRAMLTSAGAVLSPPGGGVLVAGQFRDPEGRYFGGVARVGTEAGVWTPVGSLTDTQITALAALPGGDLLAAGVFQGLGVNPATYLARYRAATNKWTPEGLETDGPVSALAVLPSGDVIAGGYFKAVEGVSVRNIARYTPATGVWSAMGTGVDGMVSALAALPDGGVIVGGSFHDAGGVAAGNFARWSPGGGGGTWSALGPGTDFIVQALAVRPGGGGEGGDGCREVIVGGRFTEAGRVKGTKGVALWSLATGEWSALGTGVDGAVSALVALPDGGVIAGGEFVKAGGADAPNIARFDAATGAWWGLGTGTDGRVRGLAYVPGDDGATVIVVGAFGGAGGAEWTHGIARYRPGTGEWSAVQAPIPGQKAVRLPRVPAAKPAAGREDEAAAVATRTVRIEVTVTSEGKPCVDVPLVAKLDRVAASGRTGPEGKAELSLEVGRDVAKVAVYPAALRPFPGTPGYGSFESRMQAYEADAERIRRLAFANWYPVDLEVGGGRERFALTIETAPGRVCTITPVDERGARISAVAFPTHGPLTLDGITRGERPLVLGSLPRDRETIVYLTGEAGYHRIVVPPGDDDVSLTVEKTSSVETCGVDITVLPGRGVVWWPFLVHSGATLVSLDGRRVESVFATMIGDLDRTVNNEQERTPQRVAPGTYYVVDAAFFGTPAQRAVIERALAGEDLRAAGVPTITAKEGAVAELTIDARAIEVGLFGTEGKTRP